MSKLADFVKYEADEKKEKHVPAIDAPDTVKKGEFFSVTVTVGKDIPHPNTKEHYIGWIEGFVVPKSGVAKSIGKFVFEPEITDSTATFRIRLEEDATLFAWGYCNIHGVWENSKQIKVE
jgi:superoxide reductase